ncbi:hypothetical protein ABK040_006114 [Willaertia magna]
MMGIVIKQDVEEQIEELLSILEREDLEVRECSPNDIKADDEGEWVVFKEVKKFYDTPTNNIVEDVELRLRLVSLFILNSYFGEAFQELLEIQRLLLNIINLNFYPKYELQYVKVLFMLSKVMKGVNNIKESKEYVESARERSELLNKQLSLKNLGSWNEFLVSAKTLCSEIILWQAKFKIEEINSEDDVTEYQKVISSHLLAAMHNVIVQVENKTIIINLSRFTEIVISICKALLKCNYCALGKRLIQLCLLLNNATDKKNELLALDWEIDQKIENQRESERNRKSFQHTEDDDDDWGVSLDVEIKGFFAGYFSSSVESEKDPLQEEIFPSNFSMFKKSNIWEGKIKKYDEHPPSLYSLELDDSSFMSNRESFIKWINNLMPEQVVRKIENKSNEDEERNDDALIEEFHHNIEYIDTFSVEWCQKYYETAWKLNRIGTSESNKKCYSFLSEYFSKLPSAKITKDLDKEDLQKLNSLFKISLALLEIAAHNLKPEDFDKFSKMKKNLIEFQSKYTDSIELIEIKGICHNFEHFIKKNEFSSKCEKIVSKIVDIFNRNNHNISSSTSNILIMDSLTHLHSLPSPAEIACEALLIFHYFIVNISPITLEYIIDPNKKDIRYLSAQSNFGLYLDQSFHYLFDLNQRTELINILYHKLPCMSPLKAFAAFSLGLYCRNISNDYRQAEHVLFESLYILSQCAGYTKLIPSLCCHIGIRILIEFAQVLTENNKYVFSSHLFKMAVENYRTLNLTYDHTLINDLAELSLREDDWKQGIFYYSILLKRANEEKQIAKYGHLSSLLSSIYIERGDFKNAENCITKSLMFMRSLGKSGDYELNLQLTLANLFLQSYNFERGIDLLARLMEEKLSPIQKSTVYINLAEAYLKKRWLKECEVIMERLGNLLTEQRSIMETNGINQTKVLEVASRCYLKLSKYAEALYCVNIALSRCTHTPYSLADLFFLKGKILQKICHDTTPISFPTTLECKSIIEAVQRIKEFNRIPLSRNQSNTLYGKRDVYSSPQDVLIDAIDCLIKAKELFAICANEIKLAKVSLFIAKTQLEFIFVPVALCDIDPSTMTRLSSDNRKLVVGNIEKEFIIPALDHFVKSTCVLLAIDGYLTISESRYLQGKRKSSEVFWKECRDVLFTLFINDSEVVVSKGAPPSFLENLLSLLQRLVRLMFCFGDKSLINNNLSIIDSYLLLETELEQVLKRSGDIAEILNDSASGDSSSESEASVEESLVSKNKIYQSLPINSSIVKGKSLPFLRKKRKYSFRSTLSRQRTLPRNGYGSQSTHSSINSDGLMDSMTLSEELCEKAWGCIFRMKLHSKKHYLSLKELNYRNQDTMRRLYHLMMVIKRRSSYAQYALQNSVFDSIKQIESGRRRHLSLSIGDQIVGFSHNNETYSPIGLDEDKDFDGKSCFSVDLSAIECTGDIEQATLEKLVYILYIDSMMIFYIPKTGKKVIRKFGGRQHNTNQTYFSVSRTSLDSKSNLKDLLQNNSQNSSHLRLTSEQYLQYEIEKYLSSLILQLNTDKKNIKIDKMNEIIKYISSDILPGPFEFRPSFEDKKRCEELEKKLEKNFDFLGLFKRMKSKVFSLTSRSQDYSGLPKLIDLPITEAPIMLLCSRSVQCLPWEIMFDHFVVRNFSLQSIVSRRTLKASKTRFKPQYFCFYSEDEAKFIEPIETTRKKWIFNSVKRNLYLFESCADGIIHDNQPNLPLHIPLLQYGRKPPKKPSKTESLKYLNFVKLSVVSENPTQIITHIESFNSSQDFPVFIFTFSDLIDLSDAIICLLNFRPDCTLLFIPESLMSTAVEFLMDMQTVYTTSGQLANPKLGSSENNRNGYRLFIHSIDLLRKQLKIPVAVINPPFIGE